MEIIPMLLKELEQEAQTTRKFLNIIPNDKFSWKPHEKSMSIQQLATHIAEQPSWVPLAYNTEEINFAASDYKPTLLNNTTELLALLEKNLIDAKATLAKFNDELLLKNWTMRNGDQIYFTMTKAELIRTTYCQIVHHRAQLGVYLRLLNIPLPGSYGPSADVGF
jgi:uncharacterized damage-inducible protein DinB